MESLGAREHSRASSDERSSDLIFDVGLHHGEDTAYYLAMGYDVVAFEADPAHVEHCEARFADEIRDGRLQIVEGAIAAPGQESVTFYQSPSHSVWGTTDGSWSERRRDQAEFVAITVPAVDFAAAVGEYGMPHYLKIDIEGSDILCLEELAQFSSRPRFVSIESDKMDRSAVSAEFELLEQLGYGRFAVVQQATIGGRTVNTTDRFGEPMSYRFEADSSGPFGVDVGPWETRSRAERRYDRIYRSYRMFGEGGLLRRTRTGTRIAVRLPRIRGYRIPGWYDTHAMLVD